MHLPGNWHPTRVPDRAAEIRAATATVHGMRIGAADDEPGNWLAHGRTYAEERHSPLADDQRRRPWATSAWPGTGTPVMYAASRRRRSWSTASCSPRARGAGCTPTTAGTGELIWQYDPEVPAAVGEVRVLRRGQPRRCGLEGPCLRRHARRSPSRSRCRHRRGDLGGPHHRPGAPVHDHRRPAGGEGHGGDRQRPAPSTACAATSRPTTGRPARRSGASTPFPAIPSSRSKAPRWKWPRRRGAGGNWWEVGGGGTVWDSMAFDPELDLLYIGVGNGSPWNREIRSPGRAATTCSSPPSSRSIRTTGRWSGTTRRRPARRGTTRRRST